MMKNNKSNPLDIIGVVKERQKEKEKEKEKEEEKWNRMRMRNDEQQ